jgi:uncharacterized repeat protein (TIGR01451 family)
MRHRKENSSLFQDRLAVVGVAGLLLLLAGLSVALVAAAQPPTLNVTKSAEPEAVEPGELVAYTITLTNTGQQDVALDSVTDTLPAQFSFAGMVSGPDPDSTAGSIVWTGLEDLGGGLEFQLVFMAQVGNAAPQAVYTNQVEVAFDTNQTASTSADVTVLGAILDGNKTASASEVVVGELLDYAVTISNSGTSTATLTAVTDTLPAQFQYQPPMLEGPAPSSVQAHELTWSNLEVGPGQSLVLRYRVQAGGPVNSVQKNHVQVTSPDDSLDPLEASVTLRAQVYLAYLPLVSRTVPPPTPYRLAFERQTPGNFEIYAVNADGTGLVNISDLAGGDGSPQYSPDGSKIAWVHFVDGAGEIFVANADGSNKVNLTNHAKEDRGPSWSPDGTKIAFFSLRLEDRWEVYTMNADGSNVQRLTARLCQSHDPVWSPDGTKIAFLCGLRSYSEVYVMNADGSNQQRLTEDDGTVYNEDAALNWSPDSTRLVYAKYHNDNRSRGNIYTVNVDTKQIVQITNKDTASHAPAWSPDGSKIAFSTYIDGSYDIVTVAPDGSNLVNLTRAAKFDNQPRWSSDGKKIAFVSNRASVDNTLALYVMNADGSNQTRVTSSTANELNPNWKPQ